MTVIRLVSSTFLALAFLVGAAQARFQPHHSSDHPWPSRAEAPSGEFGVVLPLDGTPAEWTGTPVRLSAGSPELRRQATNLINIDRLRVVPERDGAFVFWRRQTGDGAVGDGNMCLFLSGQPVDGADSVRVERTWFALYEAETDETRGVALVLPGMFGTPKPVVDITVSALRRRGWFVVRMMAHPSRFTERVRLQLDATRADESAGHIAEVLTGRAAECAYAVEAVFAQVERTHPDLAMSPCVAVGMSGGAMVLPTVIAREPDRYDAAVLIGGGANFFRITLESNYASWVDSVSFGWPAGQGERADIDAVDRSYRRLALLDGIHTSASMLDLPVLMIQGSRDKAVPARYGDLLWDQLGRPERWRWPLGHEALFVTLPARQGSVMNWLDDAVGPE